jgi:proteasome beta subunit
VEALVDAAEDDVATGGPDPNRRIFPNALAVTASGAEDVAEDEIAAAVAAVLEERA